MAGGTFFNVFVTGEEQPWNSSVNETLNRVVPKTNITNNEAPLTSISTSEKKGHINPITIES